jgi:Holliday junction resolvase RusA-like endonuclease
MSVPRLVVGAFRLHVPGDKPVGKARPRMTSKGRPYTPAATKLAEASVRAAWIAAGSPRLPDVPLWMHLTIVQPRPKSHFRANGQLSAVGDRHRFPAKRPDIDNIIKLVCDALNGCAYRDDAQIVSVAARKVWQDDTFYPDAGLEIRMSRSSG